MATASSIGAARRFGHRRLAIIDRRRRRSADVQRGRAPAGSCSTARSTTTATLRPRLEADGHRFRTSSDTETIVHAYEEFGPACVDRLEGMFAFAIYDERRRELFVARDRLGKKPFFYTVLDGVLHFASELPALSATPVVEGRRRPERPRGLSVARLFPRAGHAIYRTSTSCCPPTRCTSTHGRIETRRYWDVTEFDTDRRDERAARRRDRRDARHGRARSARERGAARRVSLRRHRLGPRRVVHGRGAWRSAGHDDGRLRRSRAQRARARRG